MKSYVPQYKKDRQSILSQVIKRMSIMLFKAYNEMEHNGHLISLAKFCDVCDDHPPKHHTQN